MLTYQFALEQFEIFTLILIRMSTFVYTAPFFNTANTPGRLKIGLGFGLAILLYSMNPETQVEYIGMIQYAVIVAQEAIIGLVLGMATSFCVMIINFSGKIIDMDIGLSMAQIYDPTMRTDMGIMGNLYYYLLMLLLIASGLHQYMIAAIFETFKAVPIGGLKLNVGIVTTILNFMGDYFVIGFRIALPVFAVTLMLNCILAIMAKIAPQMNMFVVGMQLKIFVGIFAIWFTIGMLPAVSNFIYGQIQSIMAALVRGMS